ncbi:MAG: hypothetical protein JKY65_33085 [Planctomycetes bacterium]|nr:hypothetical protein [Planctomycetota bacterium]
MNRSTPLLSLTAGLLLLALAPSVALAKDEVRVTYSVEPAQAAPGDVVELRADVVVAKGWYLYAKGTATGITLTPKLPAGLTLAGEWTEPKPVMKDIPYMGPNGTSALMGTHVGSLRFVQKVRIASDASGALEVPLGFGFQVCNEKTCLMVKTLDGSVTLTVAKPAPKPAPKPTPASTPLVEDPDEGPEPVPSEFDPFPEGEAGPPSARASVHPASAAVGDVVELRLEFSVGHPWHVYALSTKNGGPLALKLQLPAGMEAIGPPTEPTPKTENDEFLGPVASHYRDFRLTQKVRVGGAGGTQTILGTATWQACDPNQCLPGKLEILVNLEVTGASGASVTSTTIIPSQPPSSEAAKEPEPSSVLGLLKLAFAAFLLGLGMLAMPCTYPMIPITVSVFSKGDQLSRRQTVIRACAFGLGIVVSFVAVGGLVQLALGGKGQSAITTFATNPWVNLGLGIAFIYFAFSFFGFYELGLPAPLQRLMQAGAAKTNSDGTVPLWSLFLMGLFFVLTSYTCGAPVVFSLFVTAAGAGSVLFATTIFACTVAFPFVLLALVPNAIRYMPKSGSWFSVFKVVMGLVELGFAVKFMRGVDVQWDWLNILPRGVVLALWVGLSLVAGVYLLGRLPFKFPHDPPLRPVSKPRAVFGVGFLGLAAFFASGYVYELPSDVEAFIMEEQSGPEVTFGKLAWRTDLEALERAKAKAGPEGRVLLMFTGHLCVNCIKMEKQIIPREAVEARIKGVARIALFIDKANDPTEAKHANLMVESYSTSGAIPAYYVIDGEGKIQSSHVGYASEEVFLEFLAEGGIK